MGTTYGPSIIRDNLILAWDLQNSKSFIAEPTQNLLNGWNEYRDANGSTNCPTPYNNVQLNRADTSSGASRCGAVSYVGAIADSSGASFTYSCKYKVLSTDANAYMILGYHDCYYSGGGADYGAGQISFRTVNKVINQTYEYQATWIGHGPYGDVRSYMWLDQGVASIQVWDIQLEKKTHKTPYTQSYRDASLCLLDLSPYKNILALSKATFDSSAKLYFDGDPSASLYSYISAGDLTRSTRITVDVWFMKTGVGSFSDANNIFTTSRNTAPAPNGMAYGMGYFEATGQLYSIVSDCNAYYTTGPGHVIQNKWCNAVMTYDGAYERIYVNGDMAMEQAWSQDPTYISGDYDWHFGDWGHPSFTRKIKGYIDIVKVYNRALSLNEITQNYNAMKGRFGL